MIMRQRVLMACACVAAALSTPSQAADAVRWATANELTWEDAVQPAGARQALLWGDPKAGESAVLMSWKFNSKLPEQVRNQDVHFIVMAGTFTVETGGVYREFGPGAAITIPKNTKHTLGCEAAGECRVLMHHPGPLK